MCIARYCYRNVVCLSICLSALMPVYAGRIGWITSKVITRIISLGFRSSKPNVGDIISGDRPQISVGIAMGDLSSSCSRFTYLFIRQIRSTVTDAPNIKQHV